MIAVENIVYYSQFLRRGAHCALRGHMGKHQGQSGGRRSRGTVTRAFIVVFVGRNR